MEFDQFNEHQSNRIDELFSVREVMEKYTKHLKWFILSALFFLALAFLKLKYEVPQYKVSATILIKEKEKGSSFSDLSSFQDMGLFGSGDQSLENEMQIINSRRLMTKVVSELKLNIRCFVEDSPYDKEMYPNYPVLISFKSDSSATSKISSQFTVYVISKTKYEFINFDGISMGIKSFNQEFKVNLGNIDYLNFQTITIAINQNSKEDIIGKNIIINVNSTQSTVNRYLKKIIVEPVNERLSKVLTISLNESNINKGVAIVNNLIEQYNADGIHDKNEVSQATTDFLDSRISLISKELSAIENTAAQFKTKKGIAGINDGASIFLESSSANESQLIASNTQLELTDFMLEELNRVKKDKLLPINIGISNPSIVTMVTENNNLVLKRNRILKSSSLKNPIIVNIDSQLDELRNNLRSSLENQKSSILIQINSLNIQSGKIRSRIASVPRNEREFKDIVRKQEVKNALYLFLLQKKEESIISNAVSIDKAKIIDEAFSDRRSVSPKKITTYLGAIILGLIIPFMIIYIKDQLDTYVHVEKDIRGLNIPYIGDIPLVSSKKKIFIKDGDNSNVAEAFRYIRTNISFMLDRKELGKTIFVTSTLSKEGKTFTAINLATSLAISGKKTLLLGLDLRVPKMNKYMGLEDTEGVSNYIISDSLLISDITLKHPKFSLLDIINSGDIPPNPVELLMSRKVEDLFDYIKLKYDYIIVDTAPVGMVTDTIQIGKFADLTLYIMKANFLDKRSLHIPDKLNRENKLPNMAILINGFDQDKGGYGYGYGYGQKVKKPWFRK